MNNKQLIFNENIIVQKDIRFADYQSFLEALNNYPNKLDLNPDDIFSLIFSDNKKTTELNLIGTIMWEELKDKISIEEICTKIVQLFDIDREHVLNDIRLFIDRLISDNLIFISK